MHAFRPPRLFPHLIALVGVLAIATLGIIPIAKLQASPIERSLEAALNFICTSGGIKKRPRSLDQQAPTPVDPCLLCSCLSTTALAPEATWQPFTAEARKTTAYVRASGMFIERLANRNLGPRAPPKFLV